MERFSTTNNNYFSNFYKNYYCDVLDKLNIYYVSKDESHIDAFSINGNCIFCDMLLVKKFELSTIECYACIAHEVGHFIFPSKDDLSNKNQREIYADQYVKKLGLADSLISALNKMCPNDELTKLRIENMSNAPS